MAVCERLSASSTMPVNRRDGELRGQSIPTSRG